MILIASRAQDLEAVALAPIGFGLTDFFTLLIDQDETIVQIHYIPSWDDYWNRSEKSLKGCRIEFYRKI